MVSHYAQKTLWREDGGRGFIIEDRLSSSFIG